MVSQRDQIPKGMKRKPHFRQQQSITNCSKFPSYNLKAELGVEHDVLFYCQHEVDCVKKLHNLHHISQARDVGAEIHWLTPVPPMRTTGLKMKHPG